MKRTWATFFLILSAAFVALDERIKAWAVGTLPPDSTVAPATPLALAIHRNLGIAFDLPFKMPLIIAVSVLIGAFLLRLAWVSRQRSPKTSLFALIVILGALGNLYDRLAYGFTVDYLLIFARLAINLCDILIVGGVLGILLDGKKRSAGLTTGPETATM